MNKKFFYKSFLISSALISLVFLSCKNSSEPKIVYEESETIKSQVKNREQNTSWSIDIDPERLIKPVPRNGKKVSSDIPYTKEVLKISADLQSKVFPEFDDFGSLNTTELSPSIKEKVQGFCEKLSNNSSDASKYFGSKYLFSYVFFKNDLPQEIKINDWIFGEPFLGKDIMQVPVRFFCNSAVFDVTIYMNSKGNNEFYQITIDRWETV